MTLPTENGGELRLEMGEEGRILLRAMLLQEEADANCNTHSLPN